MAELHSMQVDEAHLGSPMMKAVVYRKYGSPDVLGLEEIEKPIPGDGEVLLKVQAVSINAWDWDMLTGKPFEYRFFSGFLKPKFRQIHGCDIAGRVTAVGNKVSRFAVGDEVFGDLAENGWGAFAEYVCAREDALMRKPPSMRFTEAACLSHGGNLAVQGLIDFGGIASGQRVLINGGGGSTGTLAIQLAKLFDVEVTAVDRTEKLELMRRLGADHVIDYTKADFTRDGRRYDLIFDVKTTRSIFDYKRSLHQNGAYVTVGGKTSPILQILLFGRLSRKRKLHLVAYKANKDVKYLIDLFETGKIEPIIDKYFPLEETAAAFHYYGEGGFKGKIVVTIGDGDSAQ
jgi:NADPH:quinone reductase-like Zn-dependent oxidoreductase